MNAVFHLFSLLAFLALIFEILKLQKKINFLNRLYGSLEPSKSNQVLTMKVATFLRQFSGALKISYEEEPTGDKRAFYALIAIVQPRLLLDLHLRYGITKIRVEKMAEQSLWSLNLSFKLSTSGENISIIEQSSVFKGCPVCLKIDHV